MGQPNVQQQLIAMMPRMRIWALALTRNGAAADDLVQDTAARVLAAQDSFQPGTNFTAWVHRIMRNHFISGVRAQREYVPLDGAPEVLVGDAQEDRTALRELSWAMRRLPLNHQAALSMIVLEEHSYEDAAAMTGCATGTLKSRVHRARAHLRAHLDGEQGAAA